MKINDVIVEAPMGLMKRAGQKILSKVPGTIGAKAQGVLDTGKVANDWKKQYARYLGRINQKPSTENLSAFLKQLELDDWIVSSTVNETLFIERALTRTEVDKLILTAAEKAAGAPKTSSTQAAEPVPSDKGPTNPSNISTTPATDSKPGLISKAASAVKRTLGIGSKSSSSAARIEPTVSAPHPAPAAGPAVDPAKSMDRYVNNWARSINSAKSQEEKVALAREIMNFLKDRKGSPEAGRAAAMARATLKRQPEPAVRSIAQSSAFAMERKNYVIANKLLETVGLTWKDLGYRILVTESNAEFVMIGCR